jgi:hypothetical protein
MDMDEYKQEFQDQDGVLLVRLSGRFPHELLRQQQNLFQPLVDACQAHDRRKAIVDARELQTDFDTMEIFELGEDAVTLTRQGLRVALVARQDMIDRLFEDVAFNRGGIIGVFTNMDEARDWVLK